MKSSRQTADPEWKQLLRLGEELAKQPRPDYQCKLIESTINEALTTQAKVWLSSPFYPLPGQPEIETLPKVAAPALVHLAAQTNKIQASGARGNGNLPKTSTRPIFLAMPLTVNHNQLGIVQVDRPDGPPFSKREIDKLEGLIHHAATAMEINRQEWLKNWRYQQLSLVRSVTAQIANWRDPETLYTRVTELIQSTFNLYYVAIFTLDDPDQPLNFRASAWQQQAHPSPRPDFVVHIGQGIIGQVAQTGQEIIAPNVDKEQHYRRIDGLPGTVAEAAMPLKIENRILGVLDIQSDQVEVFQRVDVLVLHTLADNISLAIESTHLYDDLHRRATQISSVFEVSHALTSILDLDELLNEVVNLIHRRFQYPFIHVFTVHSGRRKVIFEAGVGARSRQMVKQEFSYPLDAEKGIIPWVARNGQTMMVNDVSQEPLYVAPDYPPYDTRSELAVPLIVGQEVIGVLDIQCQRAHIFDDNDRSLFEALAASIAATIRNANLYRSEQWRRKVAESFRDVAYLITTNHPLNQLLDIILEKLEQNLPCDVSAIWLLEDDLMTPQEEDIRLSLAATRNIDAEKINQVVAQSPETFHMLNRALEAQHPLIRKAEDPIGPLGAAQGFTRSYSSIATPLVTSDRPLGILTLAHSSSGRYGSEAQAITSTFANYAAVAIQNARLYREAQEQALISTMLLQIAEASQSTLSVNDLLATMIRLARLLMGVRKCAFLVWQENLGKFELKAWYGFEPDGRGNESAQSLFSATLPAITRLMDEKATIYLDNPVEELNLPEISLYPEHGKLVMLPMLVRGELSGAFIVALQTALETGGDGGFDPKALSILQGIAHQTAMTIDNLSLMEARQEEAYVTAALLQVAQAAVSSTDLHDTLDTIVHLLPILVGIDACIIYLWDANSQRFRPIQAYGGSRREEENMLTTTFLAEEHAGLSAVLGSGELYVSPMEDTDLPFIEWPSLAFQPYRVLAEQSSALWGGWLLAFPLSLQNMVMGIMLVQEKNTSPAFWERRMEIINGISQQVSMVIQNDIFKQEMVENERIEREVQLARQIQETFLPASLPRMDGWELDLRWETAREVGGDFYDVFKLGDNRLGMVIADVSDKGLPAALYMTVTRTLIHAYAADGNTPAQVLQEVNELLLNDSPEAMFITVIYAILSLDTGELVYTNAGHNRPLMYRTETGQVEQLPKGGMALGVTPNIRLENYSIQINAGDILTLFTDGVVDILSPENEAFGEERLRSVLEQYGNGKVEFLLENLDDALSDFRQGARQFDDITLVSIRRTP